MIFLHTFIYIPTNKLGRKPQTIRSMYITYNTDRTSFAQLKITAYILKVVLNFQVRGLADKQCEERQNTCKPKRTTGEVNTCVRGKNHSLSWEAEAGKWLQLGARH